MRESAHALPRCPPATALHPLLRAVPTSPPVPDSWSVRPSFPSLPPILFPLSAPASTLALSACLPKRAGAWCSISRLAGRAAAPSCSSRTGPGQGPAPLWTFLALARSPEGGSLAPLPAFLLTPPTYLVSLPLLTRLPPPPLSLRSKPKGITALLALSRRLVTLGTTLAQRRLLVSLEIPSKDHAYPWFLEWMAHNSASASSASALASTSSSTAAAAAARSPGGPRGLLGRLTALRGLKSHELAVETSYKKHDNGSSEALFSLVPGPGTHWFRYRGAWMQVRPLFLPKTSSAPSTELAPPPPLLPSFRATALASGEGGPPSGSQGDA